jgi:small subunit ribosomal protein S3Ae
MAEEKESKKPIIKKKALTKKKKLWFPIIAPEVFGKAVIGETLVEDTKHMVGKTIQLSLMNLTGDMKRQNVNITFAVETIVEGKGQCKVIGYDIAPTSIKRLVRRGRMRVDTSFICQSKDGVKVRIKPFLLTAHETNKSILTALRKYATAFVATYASKNDYDAIIKDIVSGRLQMGIKEAVHTIYPIRICEIRMLTLEKESVVATAQPVNFIDPDAIMQKSSQKRAPKPEMRQEQPAQ